MTEQITNNCKLLSLLTRRQMANTLRNTQLWPGKKLPSFISHLKSKSISQSKQKITRENKTNRRPILRKIQTIGLGSFNLSLQPNRIQSRGKKQLQDKISEIQTRKKMMSSSESCFRNKKISESVVRMGKQQQQKQQQQKQQQKQHINNKKQLKNTIIRRTVESLHDKTKDIMEKKIKDYQTQHKKGSKSIKEDEIKSYTIDFMSFNYIGKVIDNASLWNKYVHMNEKIQEQD